MELCEEICQGSSFAYNVINIGASLFWYISKNVVNFALYIYYQINVTHYLNLKDFLHSINDNNEYVLIIWIYDLLVKERGGVWNG